VGTEASYRGMQGSQDQYCMHDYMQAMAMERRIKQEGLRWQRDAAAAPATAVSGLQTVGCLVQESGSFKVHQLKRNVGQKLKKERCVFSCPNCSLSHSDLSCHTIATFFLFSHTLVINLHITEAPIKNR
jgi:hypothetical protein